MRLRELLRAVGVLVLTLAVASAAVAQPLGRPLTAEQVACETDRFLWLFFMTMFEAARLERPWTLFASPQGPRDFGLLLLENQWPTPFEGEPLGEERVAETHLAATLSFEHRAVSLNPERPLASRARLARDGANSNLAASGLLLDVLTSNNPDFVPNLRVDLDRRAQSTGRAGLARHFGVTTPCGVEVTNEDLLVFSVLRRIFRFRTEIIFPHDSGTGDNEVAIHRGEEPDQFVIEVYSVDGLGPHPGFPVRFDLTLARNDQGRLTVAQLELSSPSEWAAEVVVELFVVPPFRPPHEVWPEDGGGTIRLRVPDDFLAGPVALDLEALLAGSTWNPPRI